LDPRINDPVVFNIINSLTPLDWESQQLKNKNLEVELKPLVKFQDGSQYQGEWYKGQRHGRGVYITSDGSRYDGSWHYDQRNGYGRFVRADGDIYEG